jgi:hypothetical protein
MSPTRLGLAVARAAIAPVARPAAPCKKSRLFMPNSLFPFPSQRRAIAPKPLFMGSKHHPGRENAQKPPFLGIFFFTTNLSSRIIGLTEKLINISILFCFKQI